MIIAKRNRAKLGKVELLAVANVNQTTRRRIGHKSRSDVGGLRATAEVPGKSPPVRMEVLPFAGFLFRNSGFRM